MNNLFMKKLSFTFNGCKLKSESWRKPAGLFSFIGEQLKNSFYTKTSKKFQRQKVNNEWENCDKWPWICKDNVYVLNPKIDLGWYFKQFKRT